MEYFEITNFPNSMFTPEKLHQVVKVKTIFALSALYNRSQMECVKYHEGNIFYSAENKTEYNLDLFVQALETKYIVNDISSEGL